MLNKTTIAKVNAIDSGFIPHTNLKEALERIEKSILISESSKEPINVLLTGRAGTGKTTACNSILSKYPKKEAYRRNCKVTLIPAFYALIPNPVTIKGVASALLRSLGDVAPTKGSVPEMTYRIGELLHRCETKIIILDELQHLLKRDASGNNHNVKDWLKAIINEFGVPIVVVGTPECANIINTDAQIARRFTQQLKLENLEFNLSADDTKGDFRKYLEILSTIFLDELKLDGLPDFNNRHNSLMIFAATGGNPSDISQLFKMTILNTLEEKKYTVDLTDFQKTFNQLILPNTLLVSSNKSGREIINPFILNLKDLESSVINSFRQN